MSNTVQVDQSDIRKLEMIRVFFKGLTSENQLRMMEFEQAGSRSFKTALDSGINVPFISEEVVKRLGLKIDQISPEK